MPAWLYGGNAGAVALTKNNNKNAQVKRIDVRHHSIREWADILVQLFPTADSGRQAGLPQCDLAPDLQRMEARCIIPHSGSHSS